MLLSEHVGLPLIRLGYIWSNTEEIPRRTSSVLICLGVSLFCLLLSVSVELVLLGFLLTGTRCYLMWGSAYLCTCFWKDKSAVSVLLWCMWEWCWPPSLRGGCDFALVFITQAPLTYTCTLPMQAKCQSLCFDLLFTEGALDLKCSLCISTLHS